MKVGGKTIKPTEKDASSMLMEIYMMDSGRMTRLTDTEFTVI
jgi:hypothetical protein